MPASLPILHIADAVCADVSAGRDVVVWAPPGTGKTTALPPALLDVVDGRVIVVEPRRIAARLAARFVARSRGEEVGGTVGYRVRFDRRMGPDTRLAYVTDGILATMLAEVPSLSGVSVVIFDEFHERRLASDLAFARLLHLSRGGRPDLRLAVLSATLEAERIADHMGGVVHRTPDVRFPVEVRHAPVPRGGDEAGAVLRAAEALVDEDPKRSILVFLPGMAEIRRTEAKLRPWAAARDLDVRPLHGSLPLSAQAEAVRRGVRPRIVLATNVAESSVTVEGVGAVVDTGRARVAAYDPALGETVVALRKVARAACEQRAGRAGREGPGVVVRLYSAADLARRPAYEVPEILRASLDRALLDLACANAPPLEALPLLDPPPPDRVSEGLRRLHGMGALDDAGRPTEVGRALAALPVDLPLGRLVLAGIDEQIPWLAARVAAYLDLSRGGAPARRAGAGLVDVLADLRTLEEATDPTSRRLLRDVERVARRLAPRGATDRAEDPEQALCRALLAAMPERLARVHADGRMAMVSGASARLVRASLAHGADLVVAVAAEHRRVAGRDEVVVTSAAAVDEETVVDVLADRCEEQRTVRWDPAAGRAVATVETRLGSVLLERRDVSPRDDEVRAARAAALAEVDFAAVPWSETLEVLRARAEAGALADVRAALADEAVRRALVAAGFDGRIADPSLADPSVLAAILLSPAAVARLDEAAPSAVRLANGVWVRVRYARGSSPWIEAPIQWLFGLRHTPEIAGRPVTVHLLAPNRRAVQVTSDLPGFWTRHYPQLARALRRRYPKHPFPDDPVGASPPPRAPRRPPRS